MQSLEPMKITPYMDGHFAKPFPGLPYLAMISPASIKWEQGIEYKQQQVSDPVSPSPGDKSTSCDKISFDIVIDCTGIVNTERIDVDTAIGA